MAMTRRNNKNDSIILNTIEELVPQNHDIRMLESCIDWNFIYPLVENLYSDVGRPSIDPVVLFKMIFINIIFGIGSMRKTCREIQVNLAYRWFLGISMDEKVPNYSTWSQNYIRRYGDSEVFEKIFDQILKQAISYGFVDMETVYGDSTHQKANANKNKYTDEEVEIMKKIYENDLLDEINRDREEHGKKPIKKNEKEELNFDEETGKLKRDIQTKHIKISKTDSESGCFHKGEKEKCFAYSHQTFCDRNGFVLASVCVAGNVHDSVSFFSAYKVLNDKLCHNKQLINSHFYRGVSELPYKLLFAVIYTHLEFRYEMSHTITSHHVHHFHQTRIPDGTLLDYIVQYRKPLFPQFYLTRKSFYRKTIPIIKIAASSVYSKQCKSIILFLKSSHTVWFNVVYSILIS